jgi:hypothetical protein
MRRIFIVGLVLCSKMALVHAEEASLLSQGDVAYSKREDVLQAKIAMITYERAAAADSKVAAECFWKASRSAWWLGEQATERAEKLQYFSNGIKFAQNAIVVNPDTVEAHFWLGANEGSYGDSKGVMKSLSLVKPIRHEMAEVIRLDDHYSGGGAYRVLGVVDYKVPGFMGGNKKRAKLELEKALVMGTDNPFNYYYLAEYYKITGDNAKKKAELDILHAIQAPPELVPELKMLQEKAARELK